MKDKIVLITGASKGLGKALAKELVSRGFCVYAGVRDLSQTPDNAIGVRLDLSNEESMQACVDQIIKEKEKIDVLINNAGIAFCGAVDSMTLNEVRELFEINFFGTFRLTQLVLPHMRSKKSGNILFVSSIRGAESCAYMGMYSASKAALEAIALDWAVTLAKWNINVSVVQPGPLNTGIELRHGTYFQADGNPYFPYPPVQLDLQSVREAALAIIDQISHPMPCFRFQTNLSSTNTVAKHLKDPSGMDWIREQKAVLENV